jgi:hypothetical protein
VIANQSIQAVYVAWQQPQSRRYYPIGRLVAGTGPAADLYEFSYIQGALEAAQDGFSPLLSFSDFNQVYRSREIFPFFANRLMSPRRPDYLDYVSQLGLVPDAAPMQILARGGGTRVTDSLELFPLPTWDEQIECYQTFFWMHGFRHLPPESQARVLRLRSGEQIQARHEHDNPVDSNAIQLFSEDNVLLGWVPRYLASDAVHLLQNCEYFEAYVERVNQDPAPLQQRLLCRLQSCWPDGFEPCSQPVYQPISEQATKLDPCGPSPLP